MLTLIAAFCLQDTVEGSAADRLREAIDRTRGHASLRFQGATATDAAGIEENPMLGGMLRGMGGLDGFFRGEVAGDGATMHVVVEGERSVTEFFRRGERTVQRALWEGPPPTPSPFMIEVGNLLNLQRTGEMVAQATAVTADADQEVGGRTCSVYKAALPPEAWRAEAPSQTPQGEPTAEPRGPRRDAGRGGLGFLANALRTEEVRATFWVDPESGLLRKVEVEIVRVPDPEAIARELGRMGRRGEGRGEEENPERAERFRQMIEGLEISSIHEVEFTEPSGSEISFPEEVEAFFHRRP